MSFEWKDYIDINRAEDAYGLARAMLPDFITIGALDKIGCKHK